jgi:hypothetical protein
VARHFNVNNKTGASWIDAAFEKKIIRPPVIKKRSYTNLREYYYFIDHDDPHHLYETLQGLKDITYFTVHTGFANFQIVSSAPIDPPGRTILAGHRSDFHVSVPPDYGFEESLSYIKQRLGNLDTVHHSPSPLVFRDQTYSPWDEDSETMYLELCNDFRKPFVDVLRNTHTYTNKLWSWIKTIDDFGHVIVMYFPHGLGSYQATVYCIETEYDSLLIDIFSLLPVSTVFYRVSNKLLMSVYLPYSLDGRFIVRKVLSTLKKKELVEKYTNSIVEYGYRN